jgi:hypothetical protein
MGYFIRVLGTKLTPAPLERLREAAKPALIDVAGNETDDWQKLTLRHESGVEIAAIERNPVVKGELGYDELQELLEEVLDCKPNSAVKWLQGYLPSVNVIYAFQLLRGTDVDDGWASLHRVYSLIWNVAGGILQADGEGLSDEDGFTILWQFTESVTGKWNIGVLGQDGAWVHFEMDLGNLEHRKAFMNGEVPEGVAIR